MDFELHPTITLRPRSFNVLVAPRAMLIQALKRRNFGIFYVNSSGIFNRIGKLKELEVRGACNAFKLMKILQHADHRVFIIEHDPQLYDGAAELVEDVSRAIREAAKKAAVLLYSPEVDPFLEDLMTNADRAFFFEKRMVSKALPKTQRNQTTLEAF